MKLIKRHPKKLKPKNSRAYKSRLKLSFHENNSRDPRDPKTQIVLPARIVLNRRQQIKIIISMWTNRIRNTRRHKLERMIISWCFNLSTRKNCSPQMRSTNSNLVQWPPINFAEKAYNKFEQKPDSNSLNLAVSNNCIYILFFWCILVLNQICLICYVQYLLAK